MASASTRWSSRTISCSRAVSRACSRARSRSVVRSCSVAFVRSCALRSRCSSLSRFAPELMGGCLRRHALKPLYRVWFWKRLSAICRICRVRITTNTHVVHPRASSSCPIRLTAMCMRWATRFSRSSSSSPPASRTFCSARSARSLVFLWASRTALSARSRSLICSSSGSTARRTEPFGGKVCTQRLMAAWRAPLRKREPARRLRVW
mmetsp:Transcript_30869/g.80557  ORF Transcript_30869/g.80557 Transcript_30869/m.80557 type:complete len:207 (+) Transcript_30869:902-1522(+)